MMDIDVGIWYVVGLVIGFWWGRFYESDRRGVTDE